MCWPNIGEQVTGKATPTPWLERRGAHSHSSPGGGGDPETTTGNGERVDFAMGVVVQFVMGLVEWPRWRWLTLEERLLPH